MRAAKRTLALATLLLFADPARAEDAIAHRIGRLTILTPKAGMVRSFEEGYRRHLDWHRRNGDPWTWYGWSVVMGDSHGAFVDASLGHAAQDLNAPVNPAEDAADNEKNTLPWVDRVETFLVRLRDDLSPGTGDPGESLLLQIFEYRVTPASYGDFCRALGAVKAAYPRERFAWYEFVNGGEVGRFWLVLPASRVSETNLAGVDPLPGRLAMPADILGRLRPSIASITSMVLRKRPDLSYSPGPPAP